MFCTNCGASNENDATYCVNCGESLSKVQKAKILLHRRTLNPVSLLNKFDFLKVLFDFSFNQFVSLRVMKFLYGLSILFAGLVALLFAAAGFNASLVIGMMVLLIGSPLIFLLIVICSRTLLEAILMISRMADQAAKTEGQPELKDGIEWNL